MAIAFFMTISDRFFLFSTVGICFDFKFEIFRAIALLCYRAIAQLLRANIA